MSTDDQTGAQAALGAEDREHLRLLSIFHYVVAGLVALWGCFPVVHLVVGIAMLVAPDAMGGKPDPALRWVGGFFTVFAALWMLTSWSIAASLVVAGRALVQRRRYVFCLVAAGVAAVLCMPFGTVLGVFTIIVLMRPQVKQAFGRAPAG